MLHSLTHCSNLRAYLMLTVTALCWAANVVFGKLAVGEIPPMLLVTVRWLGVVLLLFVLLGRDIAAQAAVLKRHFWFLTALASSGLTLFNALYYVAAHSTSGANLGILQGSIPVLVIIGGWLVFRSAGGVTQLIGVAITLAGVLLVSIGGSWAALRALAFNQGDLLMLLACVLFAGYTLALSRKPALPGLVFFAMLACLALMTSLPLVAWEYVSGQGFAPTATGWVLVVLVTLFPSFIAQICFIQGVALIGPSRAGVFINLVPVFATFMVVGVLDEPFEHFQLVALLLVLGGIVIAESGKPGQGNVR